MSNLQLLLQLYNMSMHLEGPWLSTTGKKKGKPKFRNAEAAKRARELEESWKQLLKKHQVEQEERKRKRALSSTATLKTSPAQPIRDTGPHIPSLNPTDMSPCLKTPDKVYTGDKILGIGTMHKSNAVPIFSSEDAKDISKMRR